MARIIPPMPLKPSSLAPLSRAEQIKSFFTLTICILTCYCLIWSFTSKSLFAPSVYNSYVLQAVRWLGGHLDLGQNYSYLEIAEYGGRYFVSFPPIPSVLLLPFCALFGLNTPDTLIGVCIGIVGACYAMKLAWYAGRRGSSALLWTLFVTVGSNFLHVGFSADVWYFAQTCSFTFTMMAIYYALAGGLRTGWLPCLCLALAFGCRPLQIVYLPLILLLLYQKLKQNQIGLTTAVRRYGWWLLPPLCVGLALMALNGARFGNPFQFGHDYLPEFAVEKELGQFSLSYLPENWRRLWSLPPVQDGIVQFPIFNGCAFWIFNPIYISFVIHWIKHMRKAVRTPALILIPLLILLHFVMLCSHATMGGWQFGNRYTIDALPVLYGGCMLLCSEDSPEPMWIDPPLMLWGLGLNLIGTIALVNQWI